MIQSRRRAGFAGLVMGALALTAVLAVAPPAQAATVFADDFSDGVADGWTMTNGSWAVAPENGNLALQQSGSADARAIATNVGRGTTLGTITTAQAKLRSTSGLHRHRCAGLHYLRPQWRRLCHGLTGPSGFRTRRSQIRQSSSGRSPAIHVGLGNVVSL
jgi:hypothetical protein